MAPVTAKWALRKDEKPATGKCSQRLEIPGFREVFIGKLAV